MKEKRKMKERKIERKRNERKKNEGKMKERIKEKGPPRAPHSPGPARHTAACRAPGCQGTSRLRVVCGPTVSVVTILHLKSFRLNTISADKLPN